jgi:hypothetical protein
MKTFILSHNIQHIDGKGHDHLDVIRSWLRQPGSDHVGVADRLDLLQAIFLGQFVKLAEDRVQQIDHIYRIGLRRHAGEINYVGEQHRHLTVTIGDCSRVFLQPRGDWSGQDIQQEIVGAPPVALHLAQQIKASRGHDQAQDDQITGRDLHARA